MGDSSLPHYPPLLSLCHLRQGISLGDDWEEDNEVWSWRLSEFGDWGTMCCKKLRIFPGSVSEQLLADFLFSPFFSSSDPNN